MVQQALHQDGPSIVLAAGLRTPWARAGVAYAREDAGHLGAHVTRELIARTGVDPASLDEVVAGCVGQPFDQANIGRVIALRAGVPRAVPGRTVARNCASGIEAVTTAIANIRAGLGDRYLTVGVEVMSSYPLVFGHKMTAFFANMMKAKTLGQRLGLFLKFRPGWLKPRIALMEGLTDPVSGLIMGSTAENLARDFGITREEADAFALRSHQRAAAAKANGRLAQEILPHLGLGAKKGSRALDHDDAVREDQTIEALAKLRPYFEKPDGVVTVGNACGITDGAAALLITTEERAKADGLEPLARIRSWAWAGCDPSRMGIGPVPASAKALDAAGCSLADMGVVELNEAFAVQVMACQRAFASADYAKEHLGRDQALGELPDDKLNVNGGAIALGHPVGATGSRLLLTAAHELRHGDHELALATLCIGGGQGGAVVLERMS